MARAEVAGGAVAEDILVPPCVVEEAATVPDSASEVLP